MNRLLDSTSGHMAEYRIKHQDVSTVGCVQRAASLLVVSARMLHGNNTAGQKPLCPLIMIMIHMTVKLVHMTVKLVHMTVSMVHMTVSMVLMTVSMVHMTVSMVLMTVKLRDVSLVPPPQPCGNKVSHGHRLVLSMQM